MRLAIIGTGRMGTAVAAAATAREWSVAAMFDRTHPFPSGDEDGLGTVDAVIDFSSPEGFEEHVRWCTDLGLPLVVGTTGLGDRLDTAREYARQRSCAVMYSPNFSLGVAIFRRALRATTELVSRLDDYGILIHEVHHAGKRDRPSGTALLLADDIRAAYPPHDSPRLEISSSRVGSVVGEHAVRFEGPDDAILIQHSARNRSVFAVGALEAAAWLVGRSGFFTLDDMLDDWVAAEPGQIPEAREANLTDLA